MIAFIQHSGNANFRYATNLEVEHAYHVFSIDRAGVKVAEELNLVVVPDLERERAKAESRAKEVLTYSEIGYYERMRRNSEYPLGESLLSLLQQKGVDRVAVPEDFPVKLALSLKSELPLEVMKNPFSERRSVKSEEEVEKIRESCFAAVDAFKFVLRFIEKSLNRGRKRTCEELRNLVELRLFSRGFLAENTIMASGIKTHQPHWIGYGELKGHLIADIFPKNREHGYFGDFTRTVVIPELGESEEIEDMLRACIEAKNRAEKIVKPGVLARDIHCEVCDVLESYGYDTLRKNSKEGFIHSTGHGVGLEVHEDPKIFENDDEIKKGMVFTVEPGLYYKKCGGVRVEDTLVVRRNGAEILTPCEDFVVL